MRLLGEVRRYMLWSFVPMVAIVVGDAVYKHAVVSPTSIAVAMISLLVVVALYLLRTSTPFRAAVGAISRGIFAAHGDVLHETIHFAVRNTAAAEQAHIIEEGDMGKAFEYEIALSYAGEDRDYVAQVAKLLEDAGVRVFFDGFEAGRLLGKDLYEHFTDIFSNRARYCVIFASCAYAAKQWTTLERRSAQARALAAKGEYILPARFDDTQIPGLLPTTAYCDLRTMDPAQFVAILLEKLRDVPEDVRSAAIAWRASGYDVQWLLPDSDLPEPLLVQPARLRDEEIVAFLVCNLLYRGRTATARAWVCAHGRSSVVARVLAMYSVHKMRRVRIRAAVLLHAMDGDAREMGGAFLESMGAPAVVVGAVRTGDYQSMLAADTSIPPLMRSEIQKEIADLIARDSEANDGIVEDR